MKRSRSGNPLVAVAYLRVSTDRQELGPEAQRAALQAWAAREGVRVVAWHIDVGVSGAAPVEGRPALSGALAAIRALGAGLLVVAKRDRIARDVVIAATVERAARAAGARLVSASLRTGLATVTLRPTSSCEQSSTARPLTSVD